jgi:glycosyltransferase involved in cell wall biosynthesis
MTATIPVRPSVALLYEKFGAYHTARLKAARVILDVTGVELSPQSADYPWFRSEETVHLVRLFPDAQTAAPNLATRRAALVECLDAIDPDAVALPGWSDPGALFALEWCGMRRRPAILMCDSTYIDSPRFVPTEWVKKIILTGVAAAFASGARSIDYLELLGIPRERIATGYDVVDNQHFREGAQAARANSNAERVRLGLPTEYGLFVGRLVEKKNVAGLIRAYAIYRKAAGQESALHLVIAGEGELGSALRAQAAEVGLEQYVHFFGHADYSNLPALYGLAQFLVLPSIVEQWGLVVNEAIASGLPVLVSNRSGASADLVEEGRNGFVFDPEDTCALAEKFRQLAARDQLERFGRRSEEIAADWDLDRFACGLGQCVQIAMKRATPPGIHAQIMTRLLLMRFGRPRRSRFW